MRETGTKEWKVLDVREGKTEPNPHGGEFQKYYVDFEGSDDTYWRRKAGDKPEVGKSYYGTITEGNYGPKFKKEKAPDGVPGGSSERSTGGSKGTWQPESERDPERAARILRQHSQGLAVRTHLESGDPITIGSQLHPDFVGLIDAFDQDVIQAGQAVNSAQGPPPAQAGASPSQSASPGPSSPPAEEHQWFTKLLEDAHMGAPTAHELGRFMSEKFSIEQKQKAERELRETQAQGDCIGRLRAAYEKSTSTVLPLATDDTDIPFRRPKYREMFGERERWRF